MGKSAKAKTKKKLQKSTHKNIDDTESVESIENAFPGGGGIGIGGGLNIDGFPQFQDSPFTPTISNPTTIFKNLRWFLVSNDRQFLSEAYVELGLIQAICNIPVQDALRGGVELKSQELGEERLEELLGSIDRDDDLNTVGQAAVWSRLFGGAGVMILTDQDPEEPLDLSSIGPDTPLEFRAVDMWELFWDQQSTSGYDASTQSYDFEWYTYYGLPVHKSRVMRMKGTPAPSFIRPRLRGWGVSVVEILVRSINQYIKATDLGFQVLDEFKIDVYKIKNLVNTLLSPNGQSQVMGRVAQANYLKNYQNAIVMDGEDDYAQKQLSFSGLAETMQGIRMQVASDMRMPMLKLFGTPATGLNASDEESIEVYNSMVESDVRNKIKYDILRMCEIKCQKLFGFIPEDLTLTFKPLRMMSAPEEQEVKTQKFNRAIAAFQAGLLTVEEFRDECNKGKIFDITLEAVPAAQGGYMQDHVKEGFNNPYNPQDVDNPGADRMDTRRTTATEVGGIGQDPGRAVNLPPKRPAGMSQFAKIEVPTSLGDKPVKRANSPEFERKSYELDGGDDSLLDARLPFYDSPRNQGLYSQCQDESRRAYEGTENKKFTIWLYQKRGGKF